jgi:hypothetical protein
MNKTLKEQLKPPFNLTKFGETWFIEDTVQGLVSVYSCICLCRNEECKNDKPFLEFVVAALNEKWERDFGEPMRWVKVNSLGIGFIDCPKCRFGIQEGLKDLNFCPNCAKKLDLPETEGG